MKIYGIIGTSQQMIIEDNINHTVLENEVLMKYERPNNNYIALSNGEWVEEKPTDDEIALEELQQEQTSLETQIEQLKDQLSTAILADNTDQIESIKAQYQTLVGGE